MPKRPELRQRRNKAVTRAVLPAGGGALEKPRLPACPNEGPWHAMAKRWWAEVWDSPMAFEFLGGDVPALFRLAALVDRFWKTGALAVASEIRLLEREFGLTPLSRRRLEWQVAAAEDAKDKHERRRVRLVRAVHARRRSRRMLGHVAQSGQR